MKIYIEKSLLLDEFYKYLEEYFDFDDIKKSEIVIFKNFEMRHRKYILKNKNLKQKFYCFFYEPLTNKDYFKIIHRLNYFSNIDIISYSKNNLELLKKRLNGNRNFYLLTNNYYHFNNISFNKNINGVINHRDFTDISIEKYKNYNHSVINKELINKNNLIIFNHWGEERNELFKNTKIFINLHKSVNSKILETFRITELIKYRVIIISQNIINPKEELFYKYIIYCDDNNLINKYNEVLNNYDFYYNKIYGNITNKELFNDINNYFLNFKNIILK